jgi:hypothetical protein
LRIATPLPKVALGPLEILASQALSHFLSFFKFRRFFVCRSVLSLGFRSRVDDAVWLQRIEVPGAADSGGQFLNLGRRRLNLVPILVSYEALWIGACKLAYS